MQYRKERRGLITVQQDATYSVYYISVVSSTCLHDTHQQELVQL